MAYLVKKGDLVRFIEMFISNFEVIAPVKKDIVRFTALKKGEGKDVVFNNPLYPAKEFFLPLKETMLEFNKDSINPVVSVKKKKTLFLMNRCDVNAVHRNDLIMLDAPADPYYREKRENAILVEIPCVVTDNCKCTNVGLVDCYDLKIMQHEKGYVLDVLTEKGNELIEKAKKARVSFSNFNYLAPTTHEFHQPTLVSDNKEVWDEYSKRCLSCSACTIVCPTCMCFTINGHLNLDLKSGNLHREGASCQLTNFTKVAGGYVFRRERGARGKQRVHCKFIYFKEKYKYPRCVGCGRCNSACPVGINIYDVFKSLK